MKFSATEGYLFVKKGNYPSLQINMIGKILKNMLIWAVKQIIPCQEHKLHGLSVKYGFGWIESCKQVLLAYNYKKLSILSIRKGFDPFLMPNSLFLFFAFLLEKGKPFSK